MTLGEFEKMKNMKPCKISEVIEKRAELIKRGYCVVSRAYRMVSRLDRPDWKEVTRLHTPHADWYRRCESKDVLVVSPAVIRGIPNSINGPQEYLE